MDAAAALADATRMRIVERLAPPRTFQRATSPRGSTPPSRGLAAPAGAAGGGAGRGRAARAAPASTGWSPSRSRNWSPGSARSAGSGRSASTPWTPRSSGASGSAGRTAMSDLYGARPAPTTTTPSRSSATTPPPRTTSGRRSPSRAPRPVVPPVDGDLTEGGTVTVHFDRVTPASPSTAATRPGACRALAPRRPRHVVRASIFDLGGDRSRLTLVHERLKRDPGPRLRRRLALAPRHARPRAGRPGAGAHRLGGAGRALPRRAGRGHDGAGLTPSQERRGGPRPTVRRAAATTSPPEARGFVALAPRPVGVVGDQPQPAHPRPRTAAHRQASAATERRDRAGTQPRTPGRPAAPGALPSGRPTSARWTNRGHHRTGRHPERTPAGLGVGAQTARGSPHGHAAPSGGRRRR